MKKNSLIILLMLVAALALVACDAAIPGTEPEVSESEESAPDTATQDEVVEAPETAEEQMPAEETGEAPPEEESADAGGRIVTAWIGPELVDCVGVAPQKCMLVKTNPDDEYGFFYDKIDGFEYEEGYEYEISVLVESVQNPPADGSALRYTLVEVTSKTPVAVEQPEESEAPAEVAEELTLEGPTWRLESYLNLSGEALESLPQTRVTITFAEGQVNGNASCNNYFGPYTADGNALTIGPLGSTMMACIAEVQMQETAYLANLGLVASYEIVGNQLELRDAAGLTVLVYSEDITIDLVGTEWTVTGYNNGSGGVTSVVIGTEMTAIFTDQGTVGGLAGCNDYRATYEANDSNIAIGPAAVTRKLCAGPEGIMEQEALYLAALEMAATYEIDGPRMDMYDEGGSRVVTFAAPDSAAEAAEVTVDMPVVAADDTAQSAEGDDTTAVDAATESTTGAADAESSELEGTSWQWVSMVTPLESVAVDDSSKYILEFLPDGVVGIEADCNSGSGTYEASDGSLSINITATTLALCPEGSLSDLFIRNLNAAAIHFNQNGHLFIDLFADAGTMEFAPN